MHTSHPNLLGLIAIDINPKTEELSMISELMGNGNIAGYIRVKEANRLCLVRHLRLRFSCGLAAPKLEDVTKGLRYLHECGIVHGDVKGVSLYCRFLLPR